MFLESVVVLNDDVIHFQTTNRMKYIIVSLSCSPLKHVGVNQGHHHCAICIFAAAVVFQLNSCTPHIANT